MDGETIALTLDVVSTSALAVGLIYGLLQLRDSRKAQHVANFAKLVELQMELRRMRVEEPVLANVYQQDVQAMEDETDIRQHFFNLMQLAVFEIAWYSHSQGQLSEDYFASWERFIRRIATEETFRYMMTDPGSKVMHADFQAYIRRLYQEADAAASAAAATRTPPAP